MNTISESKEDQILNSYNKRKIYQLKKRRDLRKAKIFISRLRFFARIASIVLLAWSFFIVTDLPQWYLSKDTFKSYPNDFLEIEGNSIISNKQIMDKLKTIYLPDEPIYMTNTKLIEEKLLELPPLKKVFIRRYWFPARLRIVFAERTPVLSIAPTPKVEPIAVFTDDKGDIKIINKEFLPLPSSKKTYKIITYDNFKNWKNSQVQYIEKFSSHIENSTGQKLLYIDIRNPDDVFIQLEDIRLRIGRIHGNSTFENIEKVRSVLPKTMEMKDDIKYLDLRWDDISIKLKEKSR